MCGVIASGRYAVPLLRPGEELHFGSYTRARGEVLPGVVAVLCGSRLEMDEDDLMSVNDLGGTSRRKHNTEAENYRKPWSDEEDGRLRSLVKEHGAQLRASPYPTLTLTLAPAITLTLTLTLDQARSSGRRSRRTCPAGTASNAASGGTTSSTTA